MASHPGFAVSARTPTIKGIQWFRIAKKKLHGEFSKLTAMTPKKKTKKAAKVKTKAKKKN